MHPYGVSRRAKMNDGIVVLGGGGHAKVVIELLRDMGEQVVACVGGEDSPDRCLDLPVLKGDAHLKVLLEQGYNRAFVAIGSNRIRAIVATQVRELGFCLVNAISPKAHISGSAKLGLGIAVMAGVVINAEAVIGNLAIINTSATVDHDCIIGDAVHIAPQCALAGCVVVGEGAFLGVGCNVIPDMHVGRNSVLGAGSVVITNIPEAATAVGVPARAINQ
jgi:UDP-perosamine 4-acetyltransferase